MYAMVCTWLDIAYVMSIMSRFWQILGEKSGRRLSGSRGTWRGLLAEFWFIVELEITTSLEGFVDSNYVGCLGTGKSLTCYVFTTYGIAISWKASL